MNINRSFKDFKFRHRSNKNQIIYTSKKIQEDEEILNLIDNFLIEKNSFIFESVEKGRIRGRYTIFGKNPDKIWEFNNKNFNEYFTKEKSNNRNIMLQSYDKFLSKKYNIEINQKTIERVKNFFQ